MSGKRAEWVEIIEPSSREKMFANPTTGEIVFTPPEGAAFKPMSTNQWWELVDEASKRNYYYNATTGDTIWNRPDDDADIIPLTKVQSAATDERPALSPTPILEPVVEETDTGAPQTEEVFNRESPVQQDGRPPSTDGSLVSGEPKRKLSDMLMHELEPLSPLQLDFPDPKFGTSKDLNKTEEPVAHAQPESADVSNSAAIEMRMNASRTLVGGSRDVRYQEHDRGSWVNIKLVNSRSLADSVLGGVGATPGPGELGPEDRGKMVGSLDRANRGRDKLASSMNSGYEERAYTLEHRGSKRSGKVVPVRPAPGLPPNKSPDTNLKSPIHSPTDNEKGHTRAKSGSSAVPPAATSSKPGGPAPAPPVAPPFKPPVRHATVGASTTDGAALEGYRDLAQHRSGFFRKKVTIANMLAWTKEPIKQPMIMTRDKQLRKEGVEMFKLLLQYMGDKKTKYKDVNLLALEVTTRAWERKGLRDEIYVQLCRQTTSNTKAKSLERGWEMIAICLAFFPPSIKFRSYLEGYLWRHVEPLPQNKGVPVEVFAQYCHKKVEKMAQSGAKKGLKKPNIEEVMHAKEQPFHPSMFGTTLEEVMEMQKDQFPQYGRPWVVQALVEAVMQLEGATTEGIFRVPGDIDEVNMLKLQMDKGLLPMDTLRDPHVPASLLKLWFRELEDPLIPAEYYQECIDNCENEANALSLVASLPDLNKSLLMYLVRFLKQFVSADNIEKTKMGVENIAMVWAPNFLRCPSDDHTLIFQNTRREMTYLRVLLNALDTEQ